jgi:hypothetical protein
MFSDTIRPVLLSPSSIDTISTSLCADMDIPLYPPGASTGTSTDDTSTLGLSSPSLSASDMRRVHSAVTERKDDTREGSDSKNKDRGNSKAKECDKEGDRDRRVERDRERDGGVCVSVDVSMSKEKAVSRYCSSDSPEGRNMKSSPYVKSESVDTYQAPSTQNNRYLKASSYSEDYTDSTHISLDNNDGSESVSRRMDQLIEETELLKLADLETAQDKQKRLIGQGQVARPKASRFPEMESKYGTPIEAATDLDYSYTTALASSKSTNALRRVSFGAADCVSVPRPRLKEGSELRVQDRMLAKLLQSKEVEVGSVKQLMNLGNFQAQMMGSRSGVRSMRRRLEEEIAQQRGAFEGVAASQSTKSRRAVSALAYLRSPAPSPFVSPRRHSTSSGLLTLDQRTLGDMMGQMAETPAPEVPSFNPLFDPSRYTVAAIASYAACNSRPVAVAGAGEVKGSAVSGKDYPDSKAVSVSRSGTRRKASKSSGGSGSASPLGHASRSKAASRPVSKKFKLIRELADLARKQSEESIRTNREDADHSVGSVDHLYTITVPSSAYPSSPKRHSSCSTSSLASAASSSSMGSPSRGSHNRAQDCVESFPVGRVCEEGGERAEELLEGQHTDAADSLQLQENRKKYQFWFKVVQMLNIKNLMSARVADQLEEARVCVRKGHVVAANRIGVCYLRYFKRRMNRLIAVYRRDHKAAKRPIRLMVIPHPLHIASYPLSLVSSSLFPICYLFFLSLILCFLFLISYLNAHCGISLRYSLHSIETLTHSYSICLATYHSIISSPSLP